MPLFRLKGGAPTTDSGDTDRGAARLTAVSSRETVLTLSPHYSCILDAWEKQRNGDVSGL